jgi:hypothetical protein
MMTLNMVLSPSMRPQRVYVDDILDGNEKLGEEKEKSPEVQRVQRRVRECDYGERVKGEVAVAVN